MFTRSGHLVQCIGQDKHLTAKALRAMKTYMPAVIFDARTRRKNPLKT